MLSLSLLALLPSVLISGLNLTSSKIFSKNPYNKNCQSIELFDVNSTKFMAHLGDANVKCDEHLYPKS